MSLYELLAEEKHYAMFHYRPMFRTSPHFHSAIELLFVEKGELEVVVGGEKQTLKAGQGCFVDSFCIHSYEHSPSSLTFVVVGAKSYFDRFFVEKGEKILSKFFTFEDFTLLKTLHAICNKPYASSEDLHAAFEGSIQILLAQLSQTVPLASREIEKQGSLVCELLRYAENHPDEDLSLRSLARRFGFSHEHLSRILHKYLSENWNTYVGRLRVRRAYALLKAKPEMSVLTAALECGFESANTFYRAYKKEYGHTPKQKPIGINF